MLTSIQQVGNGIPSLDESNEGFHLIKNLTSEDIPKSNLLFVGSERIFNSRIVTPPIRQMEPIKKDMPVRHGGLKSGISKS